MLKIRKPSIESRRIPFGVLSLAMLVSTTIVLGYAHRRFSHSNPVARSATIPAGNEREAQKAERSSEHSVDKISALSALPQTSAQFDLSRNTIAGGGGTSLVGSPGRGIILKSPDGATCGLLSIDNAGSVVLLPTLCP